MSDYKYQHGLSIMRAQPFHIGHQKLIDFMLRDCAQATVLLGSIQEQGTKRNPFSYQLRRQMIENVYRNTKEFERLNIGGIEDIHNPPQWANYVLHCIAEKFPSLPLPDVYYAGSKDDAEWFKSCCRYIEIIDRTDPSFPFVSGTMVRDMLKQKDSRWKNFINPVNEHIIEEYFCN